MNIKIIDNKNKINTSDDKKSLNNSNTDNYNIKKNDINYFNDIFRLKTIFI